MSRLNTGWDGNILPETPKNALASVRYKMISEFTWPNHDLPSDREAVKQLLQCCGFESDAAYGKTKVFIRTPRTLFTLEEQRAEMVQRIVLFLQKVSGTDNSPVHLLTSRHTRAEAPMSPTGFYLCLSWKLTHATITCFAT